MRLHPLSLTGHRLTLWFGTRRARAFWFWFMIALGVLLAFVTFASLGGMQGLSGRKTIRAVLIADFVFALMVAGFVARHVAQMIAARRRHSAGSKLHLRLVRFFTLIALVPTILVAVFATITLNFGLEGWFSDRVRDVVSNSLQAAQAYEEEHRNTLETDALLLGKYLNDRKRQFPLLSGGQLREFLTNGQLQMQRALPLAYVINGDGNLRARGERSYLFYYRPPSPEEITRASTGEVVVIPDWENNEFRALLALEAYPDHYLYVSREVDGTILGLLDETRETVRLYQQLESDRGRLLFEFALIYLGFALAVILAAMWMGMWFAERLARPVGRLAGAAQRVGEGDLNVRVRESGDNDEIALLARTFNDMTRRVKGQQDALIEVNEETERRRRLFDSVLSGVTAGVIGLDDSRRIEMMNTAAANMLELDREDSVGQFLNLAVPEFAYMLDRLSGKSSGVAKGEVHLNRQNQERELLFRVAVRESDEGDLEGYVVSFDDVTDLVVAQRMAAWGDVARRIAHEVKNPLTPIQLSAERMRRKFGPQLGEDRESLEKMTDVIIRQTNDLRRIVDEFSKFARMPAPDRKVIDLTGLLAEAVLLQENGRPDIEYRYDAPDHVVLAQVDSTMISQALTNLLKNASEAIDERLEKNPDVSGEIRVEFTDTSEALEINIIDNGAGLPEQKSRLFEPYVTNREKGTGLGLPIVRKIIEEHHGTLELLAAPAFGDGLPAGACARIVLPRQEVESDLSDDGNEKEAITGKLRESLK